MKAYPTRVANLTSIGALPHKNARSYYDAEYARMWESLAEDAHAVENRDAVNEELRLAGIDESITPAKREALLALVRQMGAESVHVQRWTTALPMRVDPEAARRTRESTNFEYNYAEIIARHAFPVAVINGEFDYTVDPRGSPLWRQLAETDALALDVVVIPDASHIVSRDEPVRLRDALRAALLR